MYALAIDTRGVPVTSFYRDRIFRREGPFRWRHACHELLHENWSTVVTAKVQNCVVTHFPMKPPLAGAQRNVDILRHEYEKGNASDHVRLFLAQDSMIVGDIETGIRLYKELVDELETGDENLHAGCLTVGQFLLYGARVTTPVLTDANSDVTVLRRAECWLRRAIGFRPVYAEPYVLLGDICQLTDRRNSAITYYRKAMMQRFGTGPVQIRDYYKALPALRLADMFTQSGDYEDALVMLRIVSSVRPSEKVQDLRKKLLIIMSSNVS